MPPSGVPETTVESVALRWLASLGWTVLQGPDIALDTPAAEHVDYSEVVAEQPPAVRARPAQIRTGPTMRSTTPRADSSGRPGDATGPPHDIVEHFEHRQEAMDDKAQEDGKARRLRAVRKLSQAFALAAPHPATIRIPDHVSLACLRSAAEAARPRHEVPRGTGSRDSPDRLPRRGHAGVGEPPAGISWRTLGSIVERVAAWPLDRNPFGFRSAYTLTSMLFPCCGGIQPPHYPHSFVGRPPSRPLHDQEKT